ncbi:putative gp51 [Streptomyces sp. Tu6071]|nr:putative gp51 [Streptomyces sp. Tu6071]
MKHMNFPIGSAIKYLWRCDLKHSDGGIEDLKKARQYIEIEIARREALKVNS